MKTAMTKNTIEARVRRLLSQMNIVEPFVDVEMIASRLNVPITRESLAKDISGFLYRENDYAVIVLNKNKSEVRQRFTIAHELGHFLLDHKKNEIHVDKEFSILFRSDRASHIKHHDEEIQANAFAATLLMPAEMLEKDLEAYEGAMDSGDIQRLAARYRVSPEAFVIRLTGVDKILTLEAV